MKREVIISTRNEKKFRELKRLFKGSRIRVVSLNSLPIAPKVLEDQKTFTGNASKKARVISGYTDMLVVADDSGLEVDALDGAPGVRSARYSGRSKSDTANCRKILRELGGTSLWKRTARFRCVIAIAHRGKVLEALEGVCSGVIGSEQEGKTGFGYDPIFIPRGYNKSFAFLGTKIKDKLSHRSKALKKAKEFIEGYFARAL